MNTEYKPKKTNPVAGIIGIILAVIWLVIAIVPFIFMILNSFKDKFEMLVKGIFQLPETLNWANYQEVLTGNFFHYLLNSLVVLGISLVILLFISACAAYPLARFKFKLNAAIYSLIVACMSIPMHITLIPVFKMTQSMGQSMTR